MKGKVSWRQSVTRWSGDSQRFSAAILSDGRYNFSSWVT